MHYVYVLKSIKFTEKIYVDYINNLNNRLSIHNDEKSIYTSKHKP